MYLLSSTSWLKVRHCTGDSRVLEFCVFPILISIWFVGSLIFLMRQYDYSNPKQLQQQQLWLEFTKINIESIERVDSYCRQLQRSELSAPAAAVTAFLVQNVKNPEEESEIRLLNAKKEKLVRENLLYFPELGQMWCLVPKAASTTFGTLIKAELMERTRVVFNHHEVGWNKYSENVSIPIQIVLKQKYGHINKIEYDHSVRNDSVKKILLVRHPFTRLVSAYEDKLKSRRARLDGMYFFQNFGSKIYRKYRRNRRIKQREPTFLEFVKYLTETDPMDYDEHWKPISLLCGLCNVRYDLIIKTEDIQNNTSSLFKALDFSNHYKLPWLNNLVSSFHLSNYFKNISMTKVIQLYKKYENDFRLFGYDLLKM